MPTPRTLGLLLLALLPAACTADDEATPPTVREVLATPRTFAVAGGQSAATLRAELDRGPTTERADVALAVTGGALTVRAIDDRLAVTDLAVHVADVMLPVPIFPPELALTDVHVHLAAPMALPARWVASGEAVAMTGPGTLRLDWSLAVAGTVYPLGSQPLSDLEVTVAIGRDADEAGLVLGLAAVARGAMWTWADVAVLSDLELMVTAYRE